MVSEQSSGRTLTDTGQHRGHHYHHLNRCEASAAGQLHAPPLNRQPIDCTFTAVPPALRGKKGGKYARAQHFMEELEAQEGH